MIIAGMRFHLWVFSKFTRLANWHYSKSVEDPKRRWAIVFFGNVRLLYFGGFVNLGDYLSYIIVDWAIQRNTSIAHLRGQRKNLLALGSILTNSQINATVWGSGLISLSSIAGLAQHACHRKLDIRCVRGPLTYHALRACGYSLQKVYGDPALLMPLIYQPRNVPKKYDIGIVYHGSRNNEGVAETRIGFPSILFIDFETTDYKSAINQITQCRKIVSRGLHGIILSEAYGVPTIFVKSWNVDYLFKVYDYYFSTRREQVVMAETIAEAIHMPPMRLPTNLCELQKGLLDAFPADLWNEH